MGDIIKGGLWQESVFCAKMCAENSEKQICSQLIGGGLIRVADSLQKDGFSVEKNIDRRLVTYKGKEYSKRGAAGAWEVIEWRRTTKNM